ncbi:MAG: hypothetical protein EOP04_00715 [Proteobacteria bacterium]|nr:MAG: hypothetical protein EOP04_00715 [Pseudomonadota bacterium]
MTILKKLTILFLTISTNAFAGQLTINAKVKSVTSQNSNNPDVFTIYLDGGSGVCGNDVSFTLASASNNKELFARTYAAALTAMTTGSYVMIHNYSSNSCSTGASFIQISRSPL